VKPSLLLPALVPTPLELARDQPVVGIDSVILPPSVRSVETRLRGCGDPSITAVAPSVGATLSPS
jgi:hypothetical protein